MVLIFAYPSEIRKSKGWTLCIKSLAFQKAPSLRQRGVVLMLCGSMMQTRPLMSLMMQTQSLFESHFRVRPSAEISFSHFILSPPISPLAPCPQNLYAHKLLFCSKETHPVNLSVLLQHSHTSLHSSFIQLFKNSL